MGEWNVPSSAEPAESGLDHVVLSGGTPAEWLAMSAHQWAERLSALARGAEAENATWITLLPHHGINFSDQERHQFEETLFSLSNMERVSNSSSFRLMWTHSKGARVIIDPSADGHVRFAATVEALRQSGVSSEDVDEELLSHALLYPANTEADLVLILGSPERIPDSMVWELAYSELVFIDIAWGDLNASHLELAIDDFNRRHRRFGGLDS